MFVHFALCDIMVVNFLNYDTYACDDTAKSIEIDKTASKIYTVHTYKNTGLCVVGLFVRIGLCVVGFFVFVGFAW